MTDEDNPPWTEEMLLRGRRGRTIRLARLTRDMTVAEFAALIGIDEARMKDHERGRVMPPDDVMAAVRDLVDG